MDDTGVLASELGRFLNDRSDGRVHNNTALPGQEKADNLISLKSQMERAYTPVDLSIILWA